MKVGEMIPLDREIILNGMRDMKMIKVANTGDRPIQIGSHYHFFEVNRWLKFDRQQAYGFRLDIPSGTSVRFEPGEEVDVSLVALGGKQIVHGLNDLTCGEIKERESKAMENAVKKGFIKEEPHEL